MDEDPEGLEGAVELLVPLEVWGDGQGDLERVARDGLDVGLEVQTGELMHVFVQSSAILRSGT